MCWMGRSISSDQCIFPRNMQTNPWCDFKGIWRWSNWRSRIARNSTMYWRGKRWTWIRSHWISSRPAWRSLKLSGKNHRPTWWWTLQGNSISRVLPPRLRPASRRRLQTYPKTRPQPRRQVIPCLSPSTRSSWSSWPQHFRTCRSNRK